MARPDPLLLGRKEMWGPGVVLSSLRSKLWYKYQEAGMASLKHKGLVQT